MKKMKSLIVYVIAVTALVLAAGCTSSVPPSEIAAINESIAEETPTPVVVETPVESNTTVTEPSASEEYIVEMTSAGFVPRVLEIRKGDTVKFVNNNSQARWPASAAHPTHTVYPEPEGCIGSKFDACAGISQGESFSFTFNEVGNWNYHDHLDPSATGTIKVQP